MNPLRHDFIRACHASQVDANDVSRRTTTGSNADGLRYLDVGCGGGIFAESAARLPTTAFVTAIDPSAEVLAVARSHARRDPALGVDSGREGRRRLTYLDATIETLPLPQTDADRFDLVSVFEVLEHVDQPGDFLDRCGAFVRPGGWLVASTIARTWTSWLVTNVVAEDLLGIVPRGTHDWNKYINEPELREHLLAKGWTSPRCMGVVYVPGFGWREIEGGEQFGNYFFGVRKLAD
jgi:ubiquinone biosynthesis O-methyltransferase